MRVRVLLAACVTLAAGAALAQVVVHDPPVQAIMAVHVNPAALAFWAGGNDPPENESKADAAARWADALKGAQTLQVQGKELLKYPRPGKWNEYAQMMIDGGAEGELAAKAKDTEKAFTVGGDKVYGSCFGCHSAYIPRAPRPE